MTLNPELWLRQQLWRLLWQGPGAVSVYLSMPTPLICVALSLIDSSQLALVSLFVLSVNVALGVLLILADEIDSCRHHNLGLLRFSAAKSRSRIEKLGVKSKQVDQFLNTLWFDRELELRFKKTRVRSVELMVLALDLLSRLASCYGRCGRRVFEANQAPIVNAMHLFESLPVAEAEKVLVEPLKLWLQDSPEFDPEGWALPLFGKF
jgi:hypothetical protein